MDQLLLDFIFTAFVIFFCLILFPSWPKKDRHLNLYDLDPGLCYRVRAQYQDDDGLWYMVASNNHYNKEKNRPRIYKMADQKMELGNYEWVRVEKTGGLPTRILFVKYPPPIEARL